MTDAENPPDLKEKAPTIRRSLVNTAITFLQNPDLINHPEFKKAAFLKKKGLTEEEITEAFNRVQKDAQYEVNNLQYANSIFPRPSPHVPQRPSFFSRLSNISSSLVIIGVALYGIHKFYTLYVEPWLFGLEPKKKEDALEKELCQMRQSMFEIASSVNSLCQHIDQQNTQLAKFLRCEVDEYLPTQLAVKDLKSDVGCIKSLLLNRHQFPAMPKVSSPTIPIWQLPSTENEESTTDDVKDTSALSEVDISDNSLKISNGTLDHCDDEKVELSSKVAMTEITN